MIIGRTFEEHRKRKAEKEEKYKYYQPWFAWYPVFLTNGQVAWFSTVYRKGSYNRLGQMAPGWASYVSQESQNSAAKPCC